MRSYLLAAILAATLTNASADAVVAKKQKNQPPACAELADYEVKRVSTCLAYQKIPDEIHKRWVLAMHCLAIEKDGLALDPYAYLHDGTSFPFSYWKPRQCYSLQGHDYLMSHPASPYFGWDANPRERLVANLPADWQPAYPGQVYIPLRGLIVPAMLKAAKARDPHTGKQLFPKGILLFVHGGNNVIAGAIEKTEKLIDPICRDGYYPVFICWNSELANTWWEQARFVRNGVDLRGNKASRTFGELTFPIYLATDLATAVVRAPRTLVDNLYSVGKGLPFGKWVDETYPTVQAAEYRYSVLRERMSTVPASNQHELASWYVEQPHDVELRERMIGKYDPSAQSALTPQGEGDRTLAECIRRAQAQSDRLSQVERDRQVKFCIAAHEGWDKWRVAHPDALALPLLVSEGKTEDSALDEVGRIIGYPLGLWGKLLIAGALEGAGESMWNMMTRRTRTMFFNSNSFQPGYRAHYDEYEREFWDSNTTGIGGFAVFLRQLEKERTALCVTAVGHSLGAMVMNEAVRQFPKVNYDRFIYMAAACSIRDFNDSIVPYLRHPPYDSPERRSFPMTTATGMWPTRWPTT
jgi:hypothetical protein